MMVSPFSLERIMADMDPVAELSFFDPILEGESVYYTFKSENPIAHMEEVIYSLSLYYRTRLRFAFVQEYESGYFTYRLSAVTGKYKHVFHDDAQKMFFTIDYFRELDGEMQNSMKVEPLGMRLSFDWYLRQTFFHISGNFTASRYPIVRVRPNDELLNFFGSLEAIRDALREAEEIERKEREYTTTSEFLPITDDTCLWVVRSLIET